MTAPAALPGHAWSCRLARAVCLASSASLVQAAALFSDDFLEDLDVELFRKQGYLLLPGFASAEEVAEIRRGMDQMLDDWAQTLPGSHRALDQEQDDKLGSRGGTALSSLRSSSSRGPDHSFFLDSATKASFFLEPGAVDAEGALLPNVSRRQAVRKVAHGLHFAPSPVRHFVRSPKIARVAAKLGWQSPVVAQTLYRYAPPLAAGVDRHQDSVTLYTDPPSCLGLWLALEGADEENGCLYLRKGSHHGELRERLVRKGCVSGEGPTCHPQLVFEKLTNATAAPNSEFTAVGAARGDLLVMHGALEHFSNKGRDPLRSRESMQLHLVEASAKWPEDNWLQYPPGLEFEALPPLKAARAEEQQKPDLVRPEL